MRLLLTHPILCGLTALSLAPNPARGQEPESPLADASEETSAGTADEFSLEEGDGRGHDLGSTLTLQLGYYDKDDSGDAGNPFLDEDVTVIEPVVIWDSNVTETFGYSVTLSYDDVSAASIDRLKDTPEQSGASGDYYYGADLGLRYKYSDRVSFGLHGGYSYEYDYDSIGVGGSVAVESEDKNTILTYSLDTFFDTVDIIRFDGDEEGDDDRTSVAGTINLYQVLAPKTHGEFGLTVSSQSGFLETPFNSVMIQDPVTDAVIDEVDEQLPNSRLRGAAYATVRHSLRPGLAMELGSRYYADDWGVQGVSIEPAIYKELVPQTLQCRLRYRYYDQTGADDWDRHFYEENSKRTQDSDLGKFHSNTVGAKFTWTLASGSSLNLAGDYVMRSDDLDHILAYVSWTWSI